MTLFRHTPERETGCRRWAWAFAHGPKPHSPRPALPPSHRHPPLMVLHSFLQGEPGKAGEKGLPGAPGLRVSTPPRCAHALVLAGHLQGETPPGACSWGPSSWVPVVEPMLLREPPHRDF